MGSAHFQLMGTQTEMTDDIAISVKNLSKKYRIFGHPGDRIKQALTFGRMRFHREFTALQDVSFEIKKGETVGIIGRNGSGKSTLLQLICGILKPTSGSIQVNGRISALLELGSGFNREFTGRENVYFQGAVMGFTKAEMDARFDDIAAFADIGEFIDQPVRTYSSGMFVRLAFSVAINAEPDILVVDEALAVGDEAFQRKCFAYFQTLQERGVALLLVSHATATIIDLCERAILMDSGQMLMFDKPKTTVGWYQKLLYSPIARLPAVLEAISDSISVPTIDAGEEQRGLVPEVFFDPGLTSCSVLSYECHGAMIHDPCIRTRDGEQINVLITGGEYVFCYEVTFHERAENILFGMMAKTLSGIELGGVIRKSASGIKAGTVESVELKFRCNLLRGTYYFNAGVFGTVNGNAAYLHRILDAVMFRVDGVNGGGAGYVDMTAAVSQ